MTWLFLQIFVYCLVSFLLGVLTCWFFVARPVRQRLRDAEAPAAPDPSPDSPLEPSPSSEASASDPADVENASDAEPAVEGVEKAHTKQATGTR